MTTTILIVIAVVLLIAFILLLIWATKRIKSRPRPPTENGSPVLEKLNDHRLFMVNLQVSLQRELDEWKDTEEKIRRSTCNDGR